MRTPVLALFALLFGAGACAAENVPKNLPYPKGKPSAEEVARQVYYANHFYAFKNFLIRRHGGVMTVIINRSPDGSVTTNTVERYLNNDYDDGVTKARDLAVFRSGNLKGTGMLVTDYMDDGRSQSYSIWLPELRKIRRFAEPSHADSWGGTVFTFGDVTLRKPFHETHEIVEKTRMPDCLGAIKDLAGQNFKYAGLLPAATCRHKGKEVYVLKSTPRSAVEQYDYRLSYVDTASFADYRTVYYRGGTVVKVIDRDWGLVKEPGTDDPRALFWKYWYGLDLTTGNETWAVVPEEVIRFNEDLDSTLWSEATLERLKR